MLAYLFLAAALPPGVVIDHHAAVKREYIGSPSIVIAPDKGYVASHDFFGADSGQSSSAVSRVFRSEDKGKTWRKTAEFRDQFWSNLFVHRGQLYLMGTTYEYGRIVIRRSGDGGRTWSEPALLTSDVGYHTAPVPIVEHKGRLWRGMEFHPEGKWGRFEAFVISAPLTADLMDAKSWTKTKRLAYPAQQTGEGDTWLEGNAVITPAGGLVDILRVNNLEKAAVVRVEDGAMVFERLIPFPGGAKKFTIRFDKKTKKYWTLSNQALPQYPDSAAKPASVRNTLVLMSSPDLYTWKVERTVLSHPAVAKHAFQYVDWQFDGQDLIVASRTAFDDAEGGAHNNHDANYLTFHRVAKFRINGR